jgi:hypothetical protein
MKSNKVKATEPKNKGGAPTKYNAAIYPDIVKALAAKGYTEAEIYGIIKISAPTFIKWKKIHPEFLKAVREGNLIPNTEVEMALLKRAKGYQYDEQIETPVMTKKNNKPFTKMEVTVVRHLEKAPDTLAQIFWLKNRDPARWRDKQDIEHSGNIGYKVIPDDLTELENKDN